jgi:hypothetical protein
MVEEDSRINPTFIHYLYNDLSSPAKLIVISSDTTELFLPREDVDIMRGRAVLGASGFIIGAFAGLTLKSLCITYGIDPVTSAIAITVPTLMHSDLPYLGLNPINRMLRKIEEHPDILEKDINLYNFKVCLIDLMTHFFQGVAVVYLVNKSFSAYYNS